MRMSISIIGRLGVVGNASLADGIRKRRQFEVRFLFRPPTFVPNGL